MQAPQACATVKPEITEIPSFASSLLANADLAVADVLPRLREVLGCSVLFVFQRVLPQSTGLGSLGFRV